MNEYADLWTGVMIVTVAVVLGVLEWVGLFTFGCDLCGV